MRLLLLTAAATLSIALASPAFGALTVGDRAPDFSAQGVEGDTPAALQLSELLERGPVVVFFLPYVFSGASVAECREFADNIDAFRAAGATVLGMSRDPIGDLARFSTECGAKFPMVSADLSTVTGFDVNDSANFATRTTYVVAASGEIAFVHDDDDQRGHVSSALAFVRAMRE